MDQKFSEIESNPANEIFKVVFFPDRIYHAAYLNATVSKRYKYYVSEVRNKHDITLLKGKVYQDGRFLANVLRIEYRAGRLNETARESNRMLHQTVQCKLSYPDTAGNTVSANLMLNYDSWIRAYQCEIWDNLKPVPGSSHQFKVLAQMGKGGCITNVGEFNPSFKNLDALLIFDLSFKEHLVDQPTGFQIENPTEDNDYMRSYEDPHANPTTQKVNNYRINFQRGWFLDANEFQPVRYSNAMMEKHNENFNPDGTNIVEMKWFLQRELGADLVYFHEVTVTPGSFEGIHQHIGSEELYYIVSGTGIAYMGADDDPFAEGKYDFELVEREIFCLGKKSVKLVEVRPGKIIYTKSGGIHGIQNPSPNVPLVFVAFGYHCT